MLPPLPVRKRIHTETKIQCQIVTYFPIIFAVEVSLANAILEEEWSISFLVVGRATVDELIEAGCVVDSVAGRDGAAEANRARSYQQGRQAVDDERQCQTSHRASCDASRSYKQTGCQFDIAELGNCRRCRCSTAS